MVSLIWKRIKDISLNIIKYYPFSIIEDKSENNNNNQKIKQEKEDHSIIAKRNNVVSSIYNNKESVFYLNYNKVLNQIIINNFKKAYQTGRIKYKRIKILKP
jgi:hypothetical protein